MASAMVPGEGSNPDENAQRRTGEYLVYFAAERTLMSWIRAALAFMALGFVIDRFGLVVQTVASQSGIPHASSLSFETGAGLVVAGALAAVVAAARYAHFARRYRQTGDTEPGYGLELAIFFTVVVALAGAVITGYLITVAR